MKNFVKNIYMMTIYYHTYKKLMMILMHYQIGMVGLLIKNGKKIEKHIIEEFAMKFLDTLQSPQQNYLKTIKI